jgi:hypothetical protein
VIWNSSADGSAGKRIGKKKRQIPVSGFSNVTNAYNITETIRISNVFKFSVY